MRAPNRWMKIAQASVLAVAVCFSLGATDANSRYYDLSHRMMCTCGCAQLVGECNHVGCTQSTEELTLLRTDIAAGMTDQQIFSAFVAKYGATVLAAPPTHGFDLVAWIAPFAVFGAALLGTILLIRHWAGLSAAKAVADAANAPPADDPAERERRERIRRETDFDNGIKGGF
jgi:cytochrome c-type biogenesis protein CcmH/NrfF